jgi:hypothetical protein
MTPERRIIRLRYRVIFALENGRLVHLGEDRLNDAIGMARRIAEDDWWEVVDSYSGNLVASSRTHGKKD